jgi:hypothetical protein
MRRNESHPSHNYLSEAEVVLDFPEAFYQEPEPQQLEEQLLCE